MIKISSKLSALSFASLLAFSACGPQKDTKAPVIDSVSVLTLTVIVTASDNVGIVGYAVTDSTTQPDLTSSVWKANKALTVESYGTYTVWVKDASGNVTHSDPIDIIKDEIAPTITSFSIDGDMMTIIASDNVGVTHYMATTSTSVPELDSIYWNTVSTFKLDRPGVFTLWVKDGAGNIAKYKEPVEHKTDNVLIKEMAKTYLHLTWLTEATGSVTIDGVTYDRAAMKAKYGDAYRYVEPLTQKEIEDRYAYLVWWAVHLDRIDFHDPYDTYLYEPDRGGLIVYPDVDNARYDHQVVIWTSMVNSEDPLLNRFNDVLDGIYGVGNVVLCTLHAQSNFMCSNEIDVASFPLASKEHMVRTFTFNYEMTLKMILEANLRPVYWFMIGK
jgi:hypothetical protein